MPLYEFRCDNCGLTISRFQSASNMTFPGDKLQLICDFCFVSTDATRIISKPVIATSVDRMVAKWTAQDVKIKHAKKKMDEERASGYRRSISEDPEGYTLDDVTKGRVPD